MHIWPPLRLLRLLLIPAALFCVTPAAAQNAPGGGGSCTAATEPDGSNGVQQAYNNGLYFCNSSSWSPEALLVGSLLSTGASASCSSTYAGLIEWTGSTFQGCNGSTWVSLGNSATSINLGTSASATNPQRTGDATTGLFSPAIGAIAFASAGAEEMRVNATGLGIGSTVPATALDVTGAIYSRRVAISYGSTVSVNWASSNIQSITLTGNWTPSAFSNGQDGGRYILIVKQDATGSRLVTWPASVRWPGGTAPTLTTTANKSDYIGFIYNGVSSTYDNVALSQNF